MNRNALHKLIVRAQNQLAAALSRLLRIETDMLGWETVVLVRDTQVFPTGRILQQGHIVMILRRRGQARQQQYRRDAKRQARSGHPTKV